VLCMTRVSLHTGSYLRKGHFAVVVSHVAAVGTRPGGHTHRTARVCPWENARLCGPRMKVGVCETAVRSQGFLVAESRVLPHRRPGEWLGGLVSRSRAVRQGARRGRDGPSWLRGLGPAPAGIRELPVCFCGFLDSVPRLTWSVESGTWWKSPLCPQRWQRGARPAETCVLSPHALATNVGLPWSASSPVL